MGDQSEFGEIKTFDPLKGFGFIRREKGKDVFVFYADIEGDDKLVSPGDQVEFLVEHAPKGPKARRVRKVGAPRS
ncbi:MULTISPECIES: retron Se72 family effector protein [unclassified Thioalkalivibrio]|uniref:retron Se72 family effector protein n=1 Tax=unclassified Thioalkalivibrio TaxID=2621013 RepID=UPI00035DCF70|nr:MULTISPECIES: retron Se72 family effector protein [unclassified Thioalkalivibrio]